jgi:hypothetical protein
MNYKKITAFALTFLLVTQNSHGTFQTEPRELSYFEECRNFQGNTNNACEIEKHMKTSPLIPTSYKTFNIDYTPGKVRNILMCPPGQSCRWIPAPKERLADQFELTCSDLRLKTWSHSNPSTVTSTLNSKGVLGQVGQYGPFPYTLCTFNSDKTRCEPINFTNSPEQGNRSLTVKPISIYLERGNGTAPSEKSRGALCDAVSNRLIKLHLNNLKDFKKYVSASTPSERKKIAQVKKILNDYLLHLDYLFNNLNTERERKLCIQYKLPLLGDFATMGLSGAKTAQYKKCKSCTFKANQLDSLAKCITADDARVKEINRDLAEKFIFVSVALFSVGTLGLGGFVSGTALSAATVGNWTYALATSASAIPTLQDAQSQLNVAVLRRQNASAFNPIATVLGETFLSDNQKLVEYLDKNVDAIAETIADIQQQALFDLGAGVVPFGKIWEVTAKTPLGKTITMKLSRQIIGSGPLGKDAWKFWVKFANGLKSYIISGNMSEQKKRVLLAIYEGIVKTLKHFTGGKEPSDFTIQVFTEQMYEKLSKLFFSLAINPYTIKQKAMEGGPPTIGKAKAILGTETYNNLMESNSDMYDALAGKLNQVVNYLESIDPNAWQL